VLRGIESLVDQDGCRYSMGPVREMHALVAARCGEVDEALSALLRSMLWFGRISGKARLLLDLWGDRPPELLAVLMCEVAPEWRAQPQGACLLEELCACGPVGVAVARKLDEVTVRGEAVSA
jgi:hypothetical protein